MSHTPTPWYVGLIGIHWIVLENDITCDSENMVARIVDGPNSQANAERIVLCVNSHDDLLAACQEILDAKNKPYGPGVFEGILDRMKAAVKKAAGEAKP
jgi:hypothetical protein